MRLPDTAAPNDDEVGVLSLGAPDDDVGGRAVLLELFDPEPDDQPHALAAAVDDLGATLRAEPSPGSEGVGRLAIIRSMHVDHLVAPHRGPASAVGIPTLPLERSVGARLFRSAILPATANTQYRPATRTDP